MRRAKLTLVALSDGLVVRIAWNRCGWIPTVPTGSCGLLIGPIASESRARWTAGACDFLLAGAPVGVGLEKTMNPQVALLVWRNDLRMGPPPLMN